MSEETTRKVQKKIESFDQSGGPDTEPMFINYAQASHAAGSAYLDVGIIPLDDILGGLESVSFHVSSRLVMSKETMTIMRDQISELLERLDGNGKITQDPAQS
jgi:hypothetical protein